MPFNLIEEPWLPVRRRGGALERVAPWQITDKLDADPISDLASPRPDFNGALIQFLIGLLQTAAAPADERAWRNWLLKPPPPQTLAKALKPLAHAFNLDGEGPRFMQDLELAEGAEVGMAGLLPETPGGKTERDNADHFVKRGQAARHCPACAAMALFSLQTNAPSGGVGHRTSLRGGGPLTTVIKGPDLWRTAWLNVLAGPGFLALAGNPAKDRPEDIFPWLAPTRTSEKKTGGPTTPPEAHPLQMFWGMPRRIRLDFANARAGTCQLCGAEDGRLVSSYITKNYGVNYEGAWNHPLSPYGRDKTGQPLPLHPQPGGLGYRHWPGLVVPDADRNVKPAEVVGNYAEKLRWRALEGRDGVKAPRLWCFGYDMDNMKARCWYEASLPLFNIPPEIQAEFNTHSANLARAAGHALFLLKANLKKAWYQRPADVKGDISFVDQRFWGETEPEFYAALDRLAQGPQAGEESRELRLTWLELLRKRCLEIFDDLSQTGHFEAADPKRIALARKDLSLGLGPKAKKITGILQIPSS